MNKGLLAVISGPSGVGKGTLLAEYRSQRENLHMSISATTRTPRPGEQDGREYFFHTREEFEAMIQNGEMLEYAEYGGNLYGTPRKAVEEKLLAGVDVILEIEVQGAMQIRQHFEEAVLIFIMPPSFAQLKKRLEGRKTETGEAIAKRMSAALAEISRAGEYDYVILNDTVSTAVKRLAVTIEAAKYSGVRIQWLVDKVSQSLGENDVIGQLCQ